jgi:hypothetical protein
MKRVAAVLAAAVLVAATVAAVAGGQAPQGRTIVLTELARGGTSAFVDNPPTAKRTRGGVPARLSVGDTQTFTVRVAQQGKPVGRLHVHCVVTMPGTERSGRALCTGVFRLNNGMISVATVLAGARNPTAVVNGGTGAYVGARGTLTSVSHRNGGDTDTLQLLP